MDEAFAGLQGFRGVVDDVMIYDQNRAEHGPHVRQFLATEMCREKYHPQPIKMEICPTYS